MNNETTAGSVAGLAPVAVILEALLAPVLPDVPAGTISAAFLALLSYVLPPLGEVWGKIIGSMGIVVLLGVGLSGCVGALARLGLTDTDCLVYDAFSEKWSASENAKCLAEGGDPSNKHCLAAEGIDVASALCRAGVAAGDAAKKAEATEKFEDAIEPVRADLGPIPAQT